jgi:hypothetical protein
MSRGVNMIWATGRKKLQKSAPNCPKSFAPATRARVQSHGDWLRLFTAPAPRGRSAGRRQGEAQGLTGEGSTLLAIADFRLSIADFRLPIGFPKQRRAALCARPRPQKLAPAPNRLRLPRARMEKLRPKPVPSKGSTSSTGARCQEEPKPPVRGGVFSLDIPFHRTFLPHRARPATVQKCG